MNIPDPDRLLNLQGQSILVTGASGTIGRAITLRLAAAGARIAAQYHQNAADSLQHNDGVTLIAADLSTQAGIQTLFDKLDRQKIQLSGLVNNAADQSLASIEDITQAQLQKMQAINVDAAVMISQLAIDRLKDGDAIVNISSIEGMDPAPMHGHYAMTKAALNMFTRASAQEFGARGVRVNSISPGLIWREGIEQQWPEGVSSWKSNAPLSRLGQPEDVADAVLFLLSPASRWISGANLVVDGGMSTQPRW